ncbi:hypothetical protein LTR84_003444 [Exophiala bonariae]|uniref:Short chain dehydrogenase n=1 Tax=Exophiala bonariae TaxID=1690606 RepID=A0AAV9N6X0_9EURO|nr:hypothetical protein LTR84_003444 [Exophiala bonariae]
MSMGKTALIIGANRSIGLRLVKALQARGWTATGSIRVSSKEDESVKDSIINASKAFGSGPLDLLINNGAVGTQHLKWDEHTSENMMRLFSTNGPVQAIKHFYPGLKRSKFAKVINISSGSASITNNNGMNLGYRVSKTSLNQLTMTIAKEARANGDNIAVVAVYSGHLATRMSGFSFSHDMEEYINGVANLMDTIDISDTGRYINWKGETVPW